MVDRIGLPNVDFFVYADDSEYTCRITQAGATIWLVSAASITDVDVSQGNAYKTARFHSPLLDLWNFRTYYQVRNRIYFYSRVAVHRPWLYKLNQGLFTLQLALQAILTKKTKAFKGFLQAVRDGHRGALGKRDNIPGV